MKKNLWLGVVVAVLIAGGLVWFQNQSTPPPTTQQLAQPEPSTVTTTKSVKVAANLPLSGPLSTYGLSVQEGVKFAIEQMESESVSLDIDWQDNAGEPKTTVSVMQKQFLADPDIYVSGVKPQTMAIIDQVSERNVPHFVWIFDPIINLPIRSFEIIVFLILKPMINKWIQIEPLYDFSL